MIPSLDFLGAPVSRRGHDLACLLHRHITGTREIISRIFEGKKKTKKKGKVVKRTEREGSTV